MIFFNIFFPKTAFKYELRYIDPSRKKDSLNTRFINNYQRLHSNRPSQPPYFPHEIEPPCCQSYLHDVLDNEYEEIHYDSNNNLITESKDDEIYNQQVQNKEYGIKINNLLKCLLTAFAFVILIFLLITFAKAFYKKKEPNNFKAGKILEQVNIEKNPNDKFVLESLCSDLTVRVEDHQNQIEKIKQEYVDFKTISNVKHGFALENLEKLNILMKTTIQSTTELFESERIFTENYINHTLYNYIMESEKKNFVNNKKADYALEANGGRILFTQCTTPLEINSHTFSFFGYATPLVIPSMGPRILIQVNFIFFQLILKLKLKFCLTQY